MDRERMFCRVLFLAVCDGSGVRTIQTRCYELFFFLLWLTALCFINCIITIEMLQTMRLVIKPFRKLFIKLRTYAFGFWHRQLKYVIFRIQTLTYGWTFQFWKTMCLFLCSKSPESKFIQIVFAWGLEIFWHAIRWLTILKWQRSRKTFAAMSKERW